eukprot:snap_masked-scaffold_10-processed-gene-9.11-mRNA-1 protein AED:1.00 eAED:1.00 QI:0/0/0/0/1/1/2/0/77
MFLYFGTKRNTITGNVDKKKSMKIFSLAGLKQKKLRCILIFCLIFDGAFFLLVSKLVTKQISHIIVNSEKQPGFETC